MTSVGQWGPNLSGTCLPVLVVAKNIVMLHCPGGVWTRREEQAGRRPSGNTFFFVRNFLHFFPTQLHNTSLEKKRSEDDQDDSREALEKKRDDNHRLSTIVSKPLWSENQRRRAASLK